MRTLQIGDEWPTERAGGLNSYYCELIRHLAATGTEVKGLVVGSGNINALTQGQVAAFAKAEDSLSSRILAARAAAMAALRHESIDLIASHFALYAMPILDQLGSTPTVVHFHGPWAAESSAEGATSFGIRAKRMLEKMVYSRADRVIVLSQAFSKELSRSFGIPEQRIRVVPGGVDLDRFNVCLSRTEARKQLGWPLDRPILLSVRRQVHRMGLEHLLESIARLVPQHPDVLLLLGGTGPLAPDLDKLILERKLEHHVQRLGRVADDLLPLAYRAADLSVVPSQALEGFGLITLESLASGTPVFVTPVGGLPEILRSFAPQCIFEGTGVAHITAGLSEALSSRQVPSESACRSYCEDNFSWTRIAKLVRAVYDEAG